jgi:hypothetical protein
VPEILYIEMILCTLQKSIIPGIIGSDRKSLICTVWYSIDWKLWLWKTPNMISEIEEVNFKLNVIKNS